MSSLTGPLLMWHRKFVQSPSNLFFQKKMGTEGLFHFKWFLWVFSQADMWNKPQSVHLVCRVIKIWTEYLKKKKPASTKYSDRDELLKLRLKTSHSPRLKLCEHHMKTDMDVDRPYIKKRSIQTNNNNKKRETPSKVWLKSPAHWRLTRGRHQLLWTPADKMLSSCLKAQYKPWLSSCVSVCWSL